MMFEPVFTESVFALSALTGRGVSMLTAGPPSVAIFVAAMVASGEPGGAAGWEAAGFSGGAISSGIAILVSAVLVSAGGSTGADAAASRAGLSATVASGFAVSGGGESSGFSAAIRSGSAGAGVIAGGTASAGVVSAAFSATGVSTRSSASTGRVVSTGWANTISGAPRQAGVLANSSWAARSKAAAPSPKTRIDSDNTMAANRKRKPGSMDANSAFGISLLDILQRPLSHRERGDHNTGRVRDAAHTTGARESG